MKVTIESKEIWKVEFSTEDMRVLKDLSNTVGIPLHVFGGLSTESPFVRVKAEKAMEMINDNVDLQSFYENHLEKPVALLKRSPQGATLKLRKKIVDAIAEYIPKGFFIAK